jgi:heptosyltransferase-2
MPLLIRTPNWLGDAVMSLPALNGILMDHPEAGLWAHSRVAGLYELFFPLCKVYEYPFLPGGHGYDSLLLFPRSFSSALAGVKAGFRSITGTPGEGRSLLLSRIRRIPEDRSRHHSLYYDSLAGVVGSSPSPPHVPEMIPSEKPHIAIFAGARYGESKMWNGFGRIASETGMSCVFYGTDSERIYLETVAGASGSAVRTGMSIRELCCSVVSAAACLGNDSGGVHLASMLGVPTVTVFGSTSPGWTSPQGHRAITVRGKAACSPCFKRTCRYDTFNCLKTIDAASVLKIVEEIACGRQTDTR